MPDAVAPPPPSAVSPIPNFSAVTTSSYVTNSSADPPSSAYAPPPPAAMDPLPSTDAAGTPLFPAASAAAAPSTDPITICKT